MKYSTRLFSSVVLAVALSPWAWAQEGACKEDVEKFCKDVKPGRGRIMKCLKEHKGELSDACKRRGAEIKEKIKELSDACKSDAEKLCQGMKPGQGLGKCMREHKDQLSEACRKKGTEIKEARKQAKEKREEAAAGKTAPASDEKSDKSDE